MIQLFTKLASNITYVAPILEVQTASK